MENKETLEPKAKKAIRRLRSHRFAYDKQVAERIRRIELWMAESFNHNADLEKLVANPLKGI